ncbi:putative aaa family protein [Neofusicoccum parvum UCRNP2]|uniref:Putative aaa family protein n=1 Tax=Botryosphaeria parva (strain UCR-NP2) TaxID=1287680 RepID=R1E6B7_BOTPV|nr:putative aaa family protein [Neofusicoccum parvum UCRNP2]
MIPAYESDDEMLSEQLSVIGDQDLTPDQDSSAAEQAPDPIFGSKPEVKALYSTSNPACDCAPRWSEHAEAAEEDRMLKKVGAASAIIQRFQRSREGQWRTSALEVQSARLNRVLADDVLRDYPDVVVREGEATKFAAPFKPFFHRWAALVRRREEEREGQTKVELGLLVDALKPTLEPLFVTANDMHRTGEIDFDNMWTVFAPGELMVFRCGSAVRLFRLQDLHMVAPRRDPRFWVLTLQQIEWNGRYFSVVQGKMKIVEADKPLQFDKLSVQPLATQRDQDAIKKKYLAKGNSLL